jgi:hypothetical protein
MVLAIFGCIFGILGIFTIGFVFVPLAALCALLGFFGGIAKKSASTAFLAIVAGILAGVGWTTSPSLWVSISEDRSGGCILQNGQAG